MKYLYIDKSKREVQFIISLWRDSLQDRTARKDSAIDKKKETIKVRGFFDRKRGMYLNFQEKKK